MNPMSMRNRFKYGIQIVLMTTLILFGYNNCSEKGGFAVIENPSIDGNSPIPNQPPTPEELLKICETDLEKIYRSTFFPILSVNCSSCHQHTQGHGSADPHESYQGFMAIGLERIQEIVDPQSPGSHDTRFNKISVAQKIDVQLETWKQGTAAYDSCKKAVNVGEPKISLDLLTQLVPMNQLERPVGSQSAKWQQIAIDLENSRSPREKNKVPAILLFDAAYYLIGDNANSSGFKLRNLRLKLKSSDVQVKISQGLRLRVEGRVRKDSQSEQTEVKEIEISTFSAYLNLDRVISSPAETLIIDDRFKDVETIVSFPGFDALFDRISFYFENIEVSEE